MYFVWCLSVKLRVTRRVVLLYIEHVKSTWVENRKVLATKKDRLIIIIIIIINEDFMTVHNDGK